MMRNSAIAIAALIGAGLAPSTIATGQTMETKAGPISVETVAGGLQHPWGIAFLPEGGFLVTERPGRLRVADSSGKLSEPLSGTPEVFAQGQGGLLDVALDPDFANNRLVYLSFAEGGQGGASTAVGRGRLGDGAIEGFEVIFRQEPKVSGPNHFGGRIVLTADGMLFLTTGERFKFDPAQDLSGHLGAIVRINQDGSVPEDNPFVSKENARPDIWSYGHRNIEAAAIDPASGQLWVAEMGPKGGDELNMPEAGKNYGWPLVSWGTHYDGKDIPDPTTRPDLTDAVMHWTPVISPSGMIFYTGDMFPAWKGGALIGGLSSEGLVRVAIDGTSAKEEERIDLGARIRDVAQAPDGSVYVLTDQEDGEVRRISAKPSAAQMPR